MKTRYSVITVSLLAIASVSAIANHQMDGHSEDTKADKIKIMVQKYNMNKNGQISKEEFVQYSQHKFNSTDTDKNGMLFHR
ncbi:MAG TPA: hypothetical protein DHW71_09400 [Gammaproteobacteria bacterium]|nr:hypothetical protein [Gammaproteobacteria bacterium]HBF09696.1 hypothetical protein [Gammaproteobacteria bacterium]HCK93191.1 hypothetical protein [Gammaproteobacteria bacterium]|tara:strand:- start:1054 stop:1296 length:243 start_codon:yes stop_codon:yes gene_type:complete